MITPVLAAAGLFADCDFHSVHNQYACGKVGDNGGAGVDRQRFHELTVHVHYLDNCSFGGGNLNGGSAQSFHCEEAVVGKSLGYRA